MAIAQSPKIACACRDAMLTHEAPDSSPCYRRIECDYASAPRYMRAAVFVSLLLHAFCALAAFSCVASAQDATTTPTFRADSQLVLTSFYAVRQRQVVLDLKPEDVRIFEDGVEQTIAVFDPPVAGSPEHAKVPVQAIFLLDVSGTVVGGGLFDARMLEKAFLAILRKRAEISIYSFAKQCRRLCPPTRDVGVLEAALYEAGRQKHDGTSLYKSIIQVAEEASTSSQIAQRVLFVVSDGLPDGDRTTSEQAADAAVKAGVRVFPILLRDTSQNTTGDEARDLAMRSSQEMKLREFTNLGRTSGGRSFDPHPIFNRDVFTRILESVADQLNVEYSVGYYSKAASGKPKRRTVTVRLRDKSIGTLHGGTRGIVR